MPFNGSEGNAIDPNKAAAWPRNYREANPGKLQSRFFGCDVLLAILNQKGCVGIRLHYGFDGALPQLLAVGANGEENDRLGVGFIVADESIASPPRSGQANVLNS